MFMSMGMKVGSVGRGLVDDVFENFLIWALIERFINMCPHKRIWYIMKLEK